MMTKVYFVRHGESESNLITQFAGSLDMPLTDKGRIQAALTAAYLRDVPFAAVYASDLSRAFDTGRAIAAAQGVPLVAEPALREIFAGAWEGKTYAALEREFSDSYGVWRRRIGMAVCPGGESVAQLQKRVYRCIEDIVHRHPNEAVCIATHATPIRVMECVWTDTPLAEMHKIPWVCNASVSVAEYIDGNHGRLLVRDIHDHLGALHTCLAHNV